MALERGVGDRFRADEDGWRFKEHPLLIAFCFLGLELLVFVVGLAVGYYGYNPYTAAGWW